MVGFAQREDMSLRDPRPHPQPPPSHLASLTNRSELLWKERPLKASVRPNTSPRLPQLTHRASPWQQKRKQ